MFDRIASWFRSLRGEKAEEAARHVAKPDGMSRRGFLRALGITAGTVILGGLTIPTSSTANFEFQPYDSGYLDELDGPWSRIIECTIQQYIKEEERRILHQRKLFKIFMKAGPINMNADDISWKVKFKRPQLLEAK